MHARRAVAHGLVTAVASIAASLLLVACGGGGGGDAPGSAPGPTGLVPSAPAVGATLLSDIDAWRPRLPGAEWVYAGRQTLPGAPALSYIARTRHSGVAALVTETLDEGDGDPTVQTLSLEGGQLRVSEPGFEGLLPPGQPFVWTELASPVRAGEQRTLLDRSDVDLGTDLDGDSRNDRADIAAWTRVVGFEDISVPALPTPVRALRMDLTIALRLRLTRSGVQAVERSEQSTWYAEGIGVVRQRSMAVTGGLVRDHALQAWDGVTRALGLFGPATVAAGDPQGFYQGRLREVHHALPVDGGAAALVLTDSLDNAQPNRVQLARLDPRGRLQALSSLPVEGMYFPTEFLRPRLLADGNGAVVVDRTALGSPGSEFTSSFVRVFRVDGQGRTVGDAAGVRWEFAGVPGGYDAVASDGSRLWFVFRRQELTSDPVDIVVHVRAPDGRELAPPMVVRRAPGAQRLTAAASPGQGLVITSYERTASGHSQQLIRVAAPGAMPLLHTLAEEALEPTGPAGGNPQVWPIVSGSQVALLWRGALLARDFFVQPNTRALLLGDALAPLRSTAGSLDTEALPLRAWFPVDRPVLALDGERWLMAGYTPALGVPPFTDAQAWLWTLQPSRAALAPQFAAVQPLSLPSLPAPPDFRPFGEPTHVVALNGGRTLVIGRHIGVASVIMVASP